MTPVEELAAAAAKLDALTGEATAGPWAVALRDGGRPIGIEAGDKGYDEVVTPGDVRCGSYCYGGTSVIDASEADLTYIAAMNPLVGKALAEMLRTEAAEAAIYRSHHLEFIFRHALRFARLINGTAT